MISQRDPRLSRGEHPVEFKGPSGVLEAIWSEPLRAAETPWLVVVGHPHPQMGGTMHNKVAQTLARAARNLGGHALRFNFRGVEGSGGQYDEGVGETQDYLTACDWAYQHLKPKRWILSGFSFGSWIASGACLQSGRLALRPEGLLLVAPPVQRMSFVDLNQFNLPVQVIQGTEDDVVSAADVERWCQDTLGGGQANPLTLVEGADHFFHGQLVALRNQVEHVYQYFLGLV